jgi:hypothetical protein
MRLALLSFFLLSTFLCAAQFCDGHKRITPQNYLLKYYRIQNDIFKKVKSDSMSILEAIANCDSPEHMYDEKCLHNHFLFVDFILYFELEEHYRRRSDYSEQEFRMALMNLRDLLYKNWMESIKYEMPNGYHEWDAIALKGETLEEFKSRGSEKFSLLETMVKRVNPNPRKRDSARWSVHEYLGATTPFSSIMTDQAMELIKTEKGRQAIEIFSENLESKADFVNLWQLAIASADMDTIAALTILSSVSAQRMYLIRDFKHWMEENLSQEEYELQMRALKQSSAAYFKIETVASAMPMGWNYPDGVGAKSTKSYHFYTTAMLAYQLAKRGFDRETVIKEATRPAKKYKRAIQIPGLAHNIWLRNTWNASTVGDFKQVLVEQKLGAQWGYNLGKESK